MEYYVVQLTQSIEAENEQEALDKFENRLKCGMYDSDQFNVEEDECEE